MAQTVPSTEMREHGMRTILFIHSSDEMYGSDVMLLQLIRCLPRERFKAIVVLPTDLNYQGLLSSALREMGIRTLRMNIAVLRRVYMSPKGFSRYVWRLLVSTVAMCRLIRSEHVAIVHSNTLAVFPGALAARLSGTPHVWHVHEIIVRPRFLWKITSSFAPRLSGRVVAVSQAVLENLCQGSALNRARGTVIRNSIDASKFTVDPASRSQMRNAWGVDPDQVLVGMVGRLAQWKGQELFLQVAAQIRRTSPNTRFAVVGGASPTEPEFPAYLRELASRLGLSSSVTFRDFSNAIPDVLAAYDIFVQPSILPEPFGLVTLEAMAAGKPVIASAHGGSIEIVQDQLTGLLIEPGNVQQTASAILRLIADPVEREEMGQRGRQRVLEQFSLENFTAKWAQVYAEVDNLKK